MTKSGIYQIRNLINNKVYIGSAVNFSARRSRHFKELKGNTHHSILLQNSFNKHGIDNFVFEILEIVEDKFKLIEREQFYFNTLKPQFNICQIAGSCLGIKRSRELVERLTAQKRGKKVFWPKEVRENAIKKMRQTLKDNPSILRDRNKKKWKSVPRSNLGYWRRLEDLYSFQEGIIVMDEAHVYMNARRWKDMPESMEKKLAQHRKDGLHIWGTVQSVNRLDTIVRELIDYWYVYQNNWFSFTRWEFSIDDDKQKKFPLSKRWFLKRKWIYASYDTLEKIEQ